MTRVDLAVIGAGPAGTAAAVTGARQGLSVLLIDEGFQPGGQVLAVHRIAQVRTPVAGAIKRGQKLLTELNALPIDVRRRTSAWAIDGTRLALSGPDGISEVDASALIIAAGGREFVPPFPGWTLPGVMTLGGAQRLVKEHDVLPGEVILIAGAGPLLWALAATLLEKDANVLGILDAKGPLAWAAALPLIGVLGDRPKLAWSYFRLIRAQRVPYRMRQTLDAVVGDAQIEGIIANGRTYNADTLCVGYGFRPNTELLQLAGCKLNFDASLGGWIPCTDEYLQTDQAGIYAAGECAGIGGADKALFEGEIAALAVATNLRGRASGRDVDRLQTLKRLRVRELRFAKILNRVSGAPTSGLFPGTAGPIVCRCQSVRADQVQQAIENGISSLDGLKNALRVGQGMCQGRTCGPILQRTLADRFNRSEADFPPFHVRPPVKPVGLSQFLRRP